MQDGSRFTVQVVSFWPGGESYHPLSSSRGETGSGQKPPQKSDKVHQKYIHIHIHTLTIVISSVKLYLLLKVFVFQGLEQFQFCYEMVAQHSTGCFGQSFLLVGSKCHNIHLSKNNFTPGTNVTVWVYIWQLTCDLEGLGIHRTPGRFTDVCVDRGSR